MALVESPLPTVLTDLEGRILGTNRLTEELLGADETDLQGQLIVDLVAEADRLLTTRVIERLASGQTRRESYETRLVRPDGRLLWIHRHVLRVDGPDGDSKPYLVALWQDVTRARLAESEAAGLANIDRRIAAGASLADIAARLGQLMEQRWSHVGCMLNIADESAGLVHPVPHSRLPAGLANALADIPISTVGIPCGMAAAYGHPVAIRDLMSDPRTVDMRPLLKRFDILSGWSVALHDVEGRLLGTLGLFHPYMREPDDADWQALGRYADVAAIAIMVARQRVLSEKQSPSGTARFRVTEPPPVSAGTGSAGAESQTDSLRIGDGTRSFLVTIAPMSVARSQEETPGANDGSGTVDTPSLGNPQGAERLSAREQEIVDRLLNGDRVPAIARALYLSQSTIRNHLTTAYRKLRVSSQQELVDLYRRGRL